MRTVLDGEIAPYTEVMEFDFELVAGQVGQPHAHPRRVSPLVRIASADGPVATLLGWELEELVWIGPGQRGVIRGDVPHLCVYPRLPRRALPLHRRWRGQAPAIGSETRVARSIEEGTIRLPQLWPIAMEQIQRYGWDVTYPEGVTYPADETPLAA